MAKLSNALKALINSPAARPKTVPAPSYIESVYQTIQQEAVSNGLKQPSWLTVTVSMCTDELHHYCNHICAEL